jgi:hypothetical protein
VTDPVTVTKKSYKKSNEQRAMSNVHPETLSGMEPVEPSGPVKAAPVGSSELDVRHPSFIAHCPTVVYRSS